MQEFVRIVSENPLTAMGIAFVVLLILYFFLMKLVKIALILLIIAVAIGGYFYFKYPEERPATLGEAVEKTLTETGRALEKGKEALDKGRELVGKGKEVFEKGREIVDKGKAALDKGIDKGKEAVEKGKDAADEIGKIIGGRKGDRLKIAVQRNTKGNPSAESRGGPFPDLQELVPVQHRKDKVEVVVVVDEVNLQVPEETLRDETGRLRGDDEVLPPVVECHRQFQRRRIIGTEITMAEGRGQEDESPGPGFVFARK